MTFREKSITKLYAFAMAAVFALVLAGCGGGGGGSAMMSESVMCDAPQVPSADGATCVDPSPTPEEIEAKALKDAQDAAMAAYTAAMDAVGGSVDPVAMTNAQKYADDAKTASEAAAAATTSAAAEGHQATAETARDMAKKAAGVRGLGLTTLANKIINQMDIDNAELEGKTGDDVPKPVSNAKRVGEELIVTATADVARVEATGSVSQGGAASATAAYGLSGLSITVTGVGTAALGGGEIPKLLTTRGDWKGRELTQNADSDSYVNVYTDIEEPKTAPSYDSTNTVALAADQIIDGDVPGDGSTFTGTLNLSATDNLPAQPGRFFCASGTTCSINVDGDGAIVSTTGYVFQPRIAGTTSTPDADYLAWGVWLTVPDATAATDLAATGAFASGNDVFEVRAELKGKATYNGVATGLYSAAGMVEYFDADVMLEANFGGTVGADSTPGNAAAATDNDGLLLGAVTGAVSNIKAGGMDVAGSLTLKRAPITTDTANGDSSAGFEGNSEGTVGGALLKGNWGGQFFGPNKETANSMKAQTEYPTTTAGTFGATGGGHTPVSLLGAFGAWKAE